MTTLTSKHGFRLALACSLLCSGAGSLAVEQNQAPQAASSAATNSSSARAIQIVPMKPLFSTEAGSSSDNRFFTDGSQRFAEMKRRLDDPVQRAQLREEQRTQLRQQHTDLAEVLEIDSATEEKLLGLLADQQFETFEHFYQQAAGGRTAQPQGSLEESLQKQADAETRRLDALSALIGEERLDRYQTYSVTLPARRMVTELDAKLATADKLRREQKERLILLIDEQFRQETERMSQRRRFGSMQSFPSRDDLRRQAQLSTIASNEAILRARQELNDVFARRAAQFLAPVQLAAFEKMNADYSETLRDWILRARVEAGLNAEIPKAPSVEPEPEDPAQRPVAGNIRVEMTLAVNGGEPVTVSQVVANGGTLRVDLRDGLSVEATPTLFNNRWLEMKMSYLEERRSGKRRIGGGGSSGTSNEYRTDDVNQASLSALVNGGRKGYAIIGTATVRQL